MSAYKIKHKETGNFISNTGARYWSLYIMNIPPYTIEKACSKEGKVYVNKKAAEKLLNHYKLWKESFEIVELN